jgi:hypothetical protein
MRKQLKALVECVNGMDRSTLDPYFERILNEAQAVLDSGNLSYAFTIDPALLKQQRTAISRLIMDGGDPKQFRNELLGIEGLLDAVADQAHDNYGLDTLLTADADVPEPEPHHHESCAALHGQQCDCLI